MEQLRECMIRHFKSKPRKNIAIIQPKRSHVFSRSDIIEKMHSLKPCPKNTLIIVNDFQRSTPSALLLQLLRQLNIVPEPFRVIIASGTHPIPNKDDARYRLGLKSEDFLYFHQSSDENNLIFIGSTKRGTPISINPLVLSAPAILTINSVEPHYFAGFSGGIKSLIPGLAATSTIHANHRWAMDPDSKILTHRSNPLLLDLWEAGEMSLSLEKVETIQLVNHDEKILALECGPLKSTFQKMALLARNIYNFQFSTKFDHIISFVANPLNHNLYQSQKAMENTKSVLKDGGNFILIADCIDGVGSELFYNRLKSFSSPEHVVSSLSFENYSFGDHKAYFWAELAVRVNLFYVGGLETQKLHGSFMKKIFELDLWNLIEEWTQQGDSILIDLAGGFTTACLKIDNK